MIRRATGGEAPHTSGYLPAMAVIPAGGDRAAEHAQLTTVRSGGNPASRVRARKRRGSCPFPVDENGERVSLPGT
jgi:hypothetical protein